MRTLDGSDAGGQFVRTALALAALEDEPIRIENVRGARSTPGLRPQHLAVLETMAAVCDADASGTEVGAETITFDPTERDGEGIPGGRYRVDVETAGSVPLLFDALLPLASALETPLSVTATGGTDVAWSPPMDYYRRVRLPLAGRFGLEATVECERRGFHPAGGGRATLRLEPSRLEAATFERRGEVRGVRVYSTESESLSDQEVAHRQADGAVERLPDDLAVLERVERTTASESPGSAVVLRIDCAETVAGFGALGERGTPAERVGEDAADAALAFLEGEAAVDRHAADQLLVILALSGGRVRIPAVTDHVEASLALLGTFGYDVNLEAGPTLVGSV